MYPCFYLVPLVFTFLPLFLHFCPCFYLLSLFLLFCPCFYLSPLLLQFYPYFYCLSPVFTLSTLIFTLLTLVFTFLTLAISTALAEALHTKICVQPSKRCVLSCLRDPSLLEMVTVKLDMGGVHVLPMMQIKPEVFILFCIMDLLYV